MLVWGAVESGNNSEAFGQNKRRASVSCVSECIPVGNCGGVCATPKNTSKSLITPATCLSSLNERARGCCNGLLRSELQSCSTQGFFVKRGLAKQTLCYHQHTPLVRLGRLSRHVDARYLAPLAVKKVTIFLKCLWLLRQFI